MMKNAVTMTRRQFLKLGSMTAAALLIGIDTVGDAYAEVKTFFSRRLASVYKRDAEMKLRKSQDNPLVKQIYRELLEHPLSEESEKLLHTEYVSRSKSIEQLKAVGVKLGV
jgi:ferredoxin hydrogenase small subunit